MRRSRVLTTVLIAAFAMGMVGCAPQGQSVVKASDSQASLSLLAESPTPGLAATTTQVTPASMQAEGTVQGVADELVAAGFVAGRQRTFQGPSKDLTLVRDREFLFESAQGAKQYLDSVRGKATAYFGEATGISELKSGSRTGYLFVPPECACHGANPVLTAVLADGPRLSWVTINGPMATKQRLQQVLGSTTGH
jgi:hypothetical protein